MNGIFNPMQTQPQLVISAPINDTQLVALIAGYHWDVKPEDAVKQAVEIVAQAVVQIKTLDRRVAELRGE